MLVFGDLDFGEDSGLVAGANKLVVEMETKTIACELGRSESTDEVE